MVENDKPIDAIDKKLEMMETELPNILEGYKHLFRNEGFNPSHVRTTNNPQINPVINP